MNRWKMPKNANETGMNQMLMILILIRFISPMTENCGTRQSADDSIAGMPIFEQPIPSFIVFAGVQSSDEKALGQTFQS